MSILPKFKKENPHEKQNNFVLKAGSRELSEPPASCQCIYIIGYGLERVCVSPAPPILSSYEGFQTMYAMDMNAIASKF